MAFRKSGIYTAVTILLAALNHSQFLIPVHAEENNSPTCNCADECTQLVTESNNSVRKDLGEKVTEAEVKQKECNANLSKVETANTKALSQLKEWETKKTTYASLFARKEKDLATLQTQFDESKDVSEQCHLDSTDSKNLSQELKTKLVDLELSLEDFKTSAVNEKNEYTTYNIELTEKLQNAENKIESLANTNNELETNLDTANNLSLELKANLVDLDQTLKDFKTSVVEEKNEYTAKNIEFVATLQEAEKNIENLTSVNNELKTSLDDASSKIVKAVETSKNLTKTSTDLDKKLENREVIITSLTELHEEMRAEISSTNEKLQKIEIDHKNVSDKLENSEQINTSLSEKNVELTGQAKGSNEKLNSLDSVRENLQQNLIDSETNYNKALQSVDVLESKILRQETSYTSKENKHLNKIEELDTEVSKLRKQVTDHRDKHVNARQDLTKLEKELDQMHRGAISSYVNRTLLIEDISSFLDKHIDNAVLAGGKASEATGTYSTVVKNKLLSVYDTVKEKSNPQVVKARDAFTKHAHPHIQSTRNMAKNVYDEHAASYVDNHVFPMLAKSTVKTRVLEGIEAIRLSMVSSLDLSSKTVINYFEVSKDERNQLNPLLKRVNNAAHQVNTNAEYIVRQFCGVTGILLALFFFGPLFFGTAFMIVFMPYYIVKYFFFPSVKKKAGKKEKKVKDAAPITLAKIRRKNGVSEESSPQ
eukprot:CAMPEP_0197828572 /NCGR_PEP_ID=MMETSP1437-20131217/5099_1 /TAXON_ID=49252 ORGANISM="Eucampia antarctica, Strain CCMP1452" /NCGR_SAMPLE_ID=MMETSP1437 /ASSEMBLY_ACC=CAM_ASM_001096 /LENGTH=709 /DNA_ID=CAMNT_0043429823 /DNA_START=44 /DNA_END=2173 /DNA_ORIENTATION=-